MRHKLSSWLKHSVLLLTSIIDIHLAPVLMLNIAVALFNLKSIGKVSLNQSKKDNKAISVQLFIALAVALIIIPSAFAIPDNLNLIGRLTTPTGSPMTGNYNFSFRVYDDSTAGNVLFELNTNLTTNSVGVYDVILQNLNLNFSDQYYLGIAVYNDEEMSPRINLTTAPYAFRANVSEALNELNTYKIGSLNVTGTAGNITFDSETLFVDVTNNRIGIGTTSPNAKLVVNGGVNITGGLNVSGDLRVIGELNVTGTSYLGDTVIQADNITVSDIIAKNENISFFNATKDEKMRITYDGKVGIGTTGPDYKLQVDGTIAPESDSSSDLGSSSKYWANAYLDGVYLNPTAYLNGSKWPGYVVLSGHLAPDTHDLYVLGGNSHRWAVGYFDQLRTNTFSASFWPDDDSSRDMGSSSNFWDETFTDELVLSNVGAAATAADTVRISALDLSAGDAGLHIKTENGAEHLFASNVGIGTTTPTHLLTVAGDLNVTGTSYLGDTVINADNITVSEIFAKDENISFLNASGSEKVRITYDGKVGIGMTSPEAKLHIARVNTSGAKAMQLNVSADSDSDTVYGIYTTVDTGTSTLSDSGGITLRLAEGIHTDVRVDANYSPGDWDTAEAHGIGNRIDVSGQQGIGIGVYNELGNETGGLYSWMAGVYNYAYPDSSVIANANLYGSRNYLFPVLDPDTGVYGLSNQIYLSTVPSGTTTGIGVYNDFIATVGDSGTGNATVYGVLTHMRTEAKDIGYAYYLGNGWGSSTGGTQYGFYSDFSDSDVTYYPIYEASNLGSNILYANTSIGSTSDPNNVLSVYGDADFTGNVGIGTTSPDETLSVNGSFIVYNSTGGVALFVNKTNGNVVVGGTQSTSNKKFTVIGDMNVTGVIDPTAIVLTPKQNQAAIIIESNGDTVFTVDDEGTLNTTTIQYDVLKSNSPHFFSSEEGKPELVCIRATNNRYVGCLPVVKGNKYEWQCGETVECHRKAVEVTAFERIKGDDRKEKIELLKQRIRNLRNYEEMRKELENIAGITINPGLQNVTIEINQTAVNQNLTNQTLINQTLVNETIPTNITQPVNTTTPINTTQPELQLLTQKITQLEARITELESQIQQVNGSVIIKLG